MSDAVLCRLAGPEGLSAAEMVATVTQFCAELPETARRICVLLPDATRTAPVPTLFRALADCLDPRVDQLTFLVALGTHPRLSPAELDALVGMPAPERAQRYPRTRLVDHAWDEPDALVTVGHISAAEIADFCHGLLAAATPVRINRHVTEADLAIACGPVFPHEVAGFSGGTKYLIPGVAGAEVINATHWAGALSTSLLTIGTMDTVVRRFIDRGVALLNTPFAMLAPVMHGSQVAGLFAGSYPATWREAAKLSADLNVVSVPAPYQQVIAVAGSQYPDMWTAAKAVYKLEPAVADDGEIVVYAPKVTSFSAVHGHFIAEIGYHVRDYFLAKWPEFQHIPLGVLAHSTHVRGSGWYDDATGLERGRIRVTLATGISEERCRRASVGWRDYREIDLGRFAENDTGWVVVRQAGEVLHRCAEVVEAARRQLPQLT